MSFEPKCWFFGVSVSEKIPLSGYIDGVEYMAAVENNLVCVRLGPIGLHFWIGPQPKETP